MAQPILIVDGMNLFVRHYCANPALTTNGDHAGGIIGFTGSLSSLVRIHNPSKVIVVWESGGSPRRRSIYSGYKEGRKPPKMNRFYKDEDESLPDTDENKIWQVSQVTSILNHLPMNQIYVPDCEADDVIGYLCKYIFKNEKKYIVSSDKDFYQLVDDKTWICKPKEKTFVKPDDILNEYNISPRNFCLAKAFCGDSSDNIPGIERIGFKTLAKKFEQLGENRDVLINEIVEEAVRRADVKKPLKMYVRIADGEDIVRRNWRLMYLDTAMLLDNQIEAIQKSVGTFAPVYNKLKVHERRRDLGLPQMDVERVCDSVAYLVH